MIVSLPIVETGVRVKAINLLYALTWTRRSLLNYLSVINSLRMTIQIKSMKIYKVL